MELKICLYPKQTAILLLVGALFLIFTSAMVDLIIAVTGGKENASLLMSDLSTLFDIHGEANLSSLFATTLLATAGILLLLISTFVQQNEKKISYQWLILGVIFIYLSVDETARIHEKLSAGSAKLFNMEGAAFAAFAWVIPGSIFVVLLALIYSRFLMKLPRKTALLFVVSGAMFITGAVVIEIAEGIVVNRYSFDTPIFRVLTQIEESLELFGVIAFIYTLLDYLAQQIPDVNLTLDLRKKQLGDAGEVVE
ncbi:MAG: hypothetical protein CUN54_08680 [Phototrophicales bacterium]|nr:MAG: hypothetical protein CUN54_08680 [Phototrophicales bacterium]